MRDRVEIVDVTPRDGLQAHKTVLAPTRRASLVEQLLGAGTDAVEAAAFVSGRHVPQMAGAEEVVAGVDPAALGRLTALVPNPRGFERAADAGLRHVRCVVVASDRLNEANFGVPTAVTLAGIAEVASRAATRGIGFGVVIGAAFVCPFEGVVEPSRVLALADRATELGADEVVLADTVGAARPVDVRQRCGALVEAGAARPGCHFHDTAGSAYANVAAALDAGIRRFDASLGRFGGCPNAPGSGGNLATEELVVRLRARGMRVDASPESLAAVAAWLERELVAGPARPEPTTSDTGTELWAGTEPLNRAGSAPAFDMNTEV